MHDGFKVLKLRYKTEAYQFGRKKNNFTRYSVCVFLPDAYDVFHKAVIEVNEEGTEAAAVTMARIAPGCARMQRQPPPPVDFIANHPFASFALDTALNRSEGWASEGQRQRGRAEAGMT